MPTIEIMRAGTHTSSSGAPITFSAADLSLAAAAYAPERKRAVLTLGHPADNLPDLGTIDRLSLVGNRLFAHVSKVAAQAVELVRAKRYKYVSASFNGPLAPDNPIPGSWYLRHVGMLGAVPPAVKGLAPLEFAVPYGRVYSFCDPACNAGELCGGRDFNAPFGYAVDEATLERYRQIQHFADTAGLSFVDAAIILGREGR